jgi:hypothetical protein
MIRAASLSIATCLLLAGCDGGLHFTGVLLTPEGAPVQNAPVYLYKADKPDQYDPVLWTDTAGRFELDRLDCTCDFQLALMASQPGYAPAYVVTTHKTLEKAGKAPIVMRLGPAPKPPAPHASPLPSTEAAQ